MTPVWILVLAYLCAPALALGESPLWSCNHFRPQRMSPCHTM